MSVACKELPGVVAIIQARMSSSRLPGKVLKPMGGKAVLAQVIERGQGFATQVVVCTSVDPTDDPIEKFCIENAVVCVRGSLLDVFSRFRKTLLDERVLNTPWFARITADCPLLSDAFARTLCSYISPELDYIRADSEALPLGVTVELINRASFMAIDEGSLDPPEREHVTLRLYETADRYRIKIVPPPDTLRAPQFRLTLDYEDDYKLFLRLFDKKTALTTEEAVKILRADPEMAAINQGCMQKKARINKALA